MIKRRQTANEIIHFISAEIKEMMVYIFRIGGTAMIKMERFGTIINIFLGIVVSLVLGLYIQYVHNAFTVPQILHGFLSSFFISYVIGDLLPAKKWGNALTTKLGLMEGALIQHIISTAVLALGMVTLISFFSVYIAIGPVDNLFAAWWTNYPSVLLLGYITLLLFFPAALKTAVLLTQQNPQKQSTD